MKHPITGEPAKLTHHTVTRSFRKESFEVVEHFYQSEESGETFSTEEQDELALQQVYNLFRERHHIPFPAEIRRIREQYGLSASKMSEVLDFGINSYRNYEQGEIPSLANAKLIRLARDPHNFRRFVEEKEAIFSKNAFRKAMDKLASLTQENRLDSVVSYLWNFHLEANSFTGFVKPSFDKVANFVLYFAKQIQPRKTRLNKLMFYADFLHYKQHGFSISGCNYRAIPFGPVPSHFRELFGMLEAEGYVQIEEEIFEHGGVGERFIADKQEFDETIFSASELVAMKQVAEKFAQTKTAEIIDISHEEDGWKDNHAARELINYQSYAFELKGI
ncbi:type II toxin-antitoxin system antitoxin SocA domain-containing protein [Pontibacter sp. G13]|uniref:type II toxin-antitoxin system antitoxin SocA domain-containing protein n=1 Tax=Pontibacter sp. G13 TaxID=3074898 RepID=UPI00288A4707|nr:type II toxin-antitoxin system antitoxin SocA domain-containing protein [Pontibacter sp. G13]WNJ16510.1 DUF4065 domain-containing protein [Pontibacter sp. G13]